MKRLSIVALVIALPFGGACSDPQSPEVALPALMPLAVGNSWEHIALSIVNGDTAIRDTTQLEILGTALPQSAEPYFKTSTQLVFGDRDGGLSVARYDDEQNVLEDFEFLLKYPVESEDDYYYRSPHLPGSPGVTISTRTDTVITFLGPFLGLTYTINGPTPQHFLEFGFAPGVGLITMENAWGTRWVLMSYALANP